MLGDRKVIEWMPGKWWVVEVTGEDGSYTPLHEGQGVTAIQCQADAQGWLERNPRTLEPMTRADAYAAGLYRFAVPSVSTGLWTEADWIRYIDLNNGWTVTIREE